MTGPRRLRFGFSPCPNDTFAFWAAVHGRGACGGHGVVLDPVMDDIEGLNERAVRGTDRLEVTKLSLPALAAVGATHVALGAGAALGHGVGPLVVVRDDSPVRDLEALRGLRVAVPGANTTALLLLRLALGGSCTLVPMRFERIMPAVARGECDGGLVIHESRFTYASHGLRSVADLGTWWEGVSGLPIPLAVIAARKDLPRPVVESVETVLRASVQHALAHPAYPRPFVRAHSQEMSDEVCDRHIALYVNRFSIDLGEEGRAAVRELLARGRAAGLLPDGTDPFAP
ncbi:MAG: hypothetical protein RL148_2927 [Planctomycetota bacterium]